MLKSINTCAWEYQKQTKIAETHAHGLLLWWCSATATCFEAGGASCQSMQPISAHTPCQTFLLSPLCPGLPFDLFQHPLGGAASCPCDNWQPQKPFKASGKRVWLSDNTHHSNNAWSTNICMLLLPACTCVSTHACSLSNIHGAVCACSYGSIRSQACKYASQTTP